LLIYGDDPLLDLTARSNSAFASRSDGARPIIRFGRRPCRLYGQIGVVYASTIAARDRPSQNVAYLVPVLGEDMRKAFDVAASILSAAMPLIVVLYFALWLLWI
jgi:hypothetical protein